MNLRKIILSIVGVLLIVLAFFFAGKIIDNKKSMKPSAQKVVKTVFTEVVKNGTVPIVVPANGNLNAKKGRTVCRGTRCFYRGQYPLQDGHAV